jgi:superfamily II RNA helicase
MDKIRRYRKQAKQLEAKIQDVKNMCWENFEKVVNLLRNENYLDKNYKPTPKGISCASLRTDNSFFITELVYSGMFEELDPKEFAGLISCFVIGESKARERAYSSISKVAIKYEKQYKNIARSVVQKQRNWGIDRSVELNANLSSIVEDWAGGISWDELIANTQYDDGDILRTLRRTCEISKQLSKLPNISNKLQGLAAESCKLIERDLVIEAI